MPILFEELRELLMEKLLILGKGQKYGQGLILAGGAGSGKGWVIKNLIGGDWKTYDPDELKTALIKVSQAIKANPKEFGDKFKKVTSVSDIVAGLELKNPADVTKLHMMVKDLGLDDKQLLLTLFANKNSDNKPNIIMDCTLKSDRAAEEAVNRLRDYGYKPENIHIVWVLTDYKVALKQNYTRDRRVYNHILIDTHIGAKTTMTNLVFKHYGKLGINGDLCVVFGGRAQMVDAQGNPAKTGGTIQMRSEYSGEPLYLRLKKAGQSGLDERGLNNVLDWAERLAPKTKEKATDFAKAFPETQLK